MKGYYSADFVRDTYFVKDWQKVIVLLISPTSQYKNTAIIRGIIVKITFESLIILMAK